jgi:uncharacterized OB-fold protein
MTMLRRPEPRRGIYDAEFWEFVQREELRIQRCSACAALRYPPAPVCPQCLSPECEWTPLSGKGTVLAWTTFHRQYFPELPVPYTVVAVETAEGPIVIGNYVNSGGRRAACGDEVRLVFEDVEGELENWKIHQWEPTRRRVIREH